MRSESTPPQEEPQARGGGRLRRAAAWLQQRDPGVLAPLELLARPRSERGAAPMLLIAAPPRSGSTLLYQLLVHALDTDFVSNFHYLWPRQPATAWRMGRRFLKPYVSDFRSTYGFVGGLNGPAEAERFWGYWFDQPLIEKTPAPPPERLARSGDFFRWLHRKTGRPFVTGYIGHAFYVEPMLELFPQAVAFCLRRDPLAVARSLLTARVRRGGDITEWASLFPRECAELDSRTPHEQVAAQAFFIARRITDQAARFADRVITLDYEELCREPRQVVERAQAKLRELGGEAVRRNDTEIPDAFEPSRRSPDADDDSRQIARALERLRGETAGGAPVV